ncbi:sigma 54-interacting transcriptional regulator [Pseudoflavonifractor phocaeensis]|uniref:sigma-54 interaction domain-containing protein n=1 Tax=Pseudoflavonifractor phocaeensis TaxID=1870988 RepID=UPI0025A43DFA|nr:sigma 54-interacting transcriptional regulator [Pseudoflavonifractor phocaeensis]MDM8239143.1 sigma 54-interacting transcriptional regulator [Pseudoflavonifractor phocaeensis]
MKLNYVDSMMIVDQDLNPLFTQRFNPRFDQDPKSNEYEEYYGKKFFEIYPGIDQSNSTMAQCLRTGQTIYRQNQVFSDYLGRKYHTNNITFPIIRYGKVVGAIELSQDITSIGDLIKPDDPMRSSKNEMKVLKTLPADTAISFNEIITRNEEMQDNIKKAKIFSRSMNPVLIYGETGTGKEMFVKAIANCMGISKNKYITQNCAAIPESLFESLLFGTSKGSFTGAENKKGLFELADGGILFLDELNSMPLYLQAKLLRVIQDGMIRPIGSPVEKSVNVKVIVAVNQNPRNLIKSGQFREDLFYRLSSNMIYLVPLRDRKEDITLYIDYFVKEFSTRYGNTVNRLSSSLVTMFMNYTWPGNVRELRHILEYMVSVCESDVLTTRNLPIYFREVINSELSPSKDDLDDDKIESGTFCQSLPDIVKKTERKYIEQALRLTNGNLSQAAELLGIPRQTLKYKVQKLEIEL